MLSDSGDEKISILQARALAASKKNKEAIDFLRDRSEKRASWLVSHLWLGKFYAAEVDGGWNARKHLMTFIKRAEPFTAAKEDSASPEGKDWKIMKLEAENLLERVNKSLD